MLSDRALAERIEAVKRRIADACRTVGRDPASVTLVAVTKTVPVEVVRSAYGLGLRHFGESRFQEALPKVSNMPADAVWHFVGTLQSNKAKKVASVFHLLHTVEKESQLIEIEKGDTAVDVLVEVNVAEEPQKSGVSPANLDRFLQRLSCYGNVRYRGLMTIGPQTSDPEHSRSVFRELARLGRAHGAELLSMGMSADYDVAIQEGATHVRVGSAVFGERA